jgi:hypothetical protein
MTIARVLSSVSAAIITRFTTALLAGCATLLMTASPVLAQESLLLGDGLTPEGSGVAYNPKQEFAQEWTAPKSGALTSIQWYSPIGWLTCHLVGQTFCPSTIQRAGIREDGGGKPGRVLAETANQVGLPLIGAWNSIPLSGLPVAVTAGKRYWLAYIGENGFLAVGYHGLGGPCKLGAPHCGTINFGNFFGSTETITTTNEWLPEQEGFANGPLATAAYGTLPPTAASRH